MRTKLILAFLAIALLVAVLFGGAFAQSNAQPARVQLTREQKQRLAQMEPVDIGSQVRKARQKRRGAARPSRR